MNARLRLGKWPTRDSIDAILKQSGIFDFLSENNATRHVLYRHETGVHILLTARYLIDLKQWLTERKNSDWILQTPPRFGGLLNAGQLAFEQSTDNAYLACESIFNDIYNVRIEIFDQLPDGTFANRSRAGILRNCCFGVSDQALSGIVVGTPAHSLYTQTAPQDDIPPISIHDSDPIDAVFTWVDSSDPAWQKRKAKFAPRINESRSDNDLRFLSRNELRYAIRSVLKHAPWVRHVFIVTDQQRPSWLKENGRVKVVDHREIFADVDALPVFNSHAIECNLHRIPGLSERFLYFNDDVFLGRRVTPADFYSSDGKPVVFFSPKMTYDPAFVATLTHATDAAFSKTIELIQRDFGYTPLSKVLHTPHPMRKSVLEEIVGRYPDLVAATSRTRIRSTSDINLCANFFQHYCVATQRAAFPHKQNKFYTYIDTGKHGAALKLRRLRWSQTKYFCLNLTDFDDVDHRKQAKLLRSIFLLRYPLRGPHEISRLDEWRQK